MKKTFEDVEDSWDDFLSVVHSAVEGKSSNDLKKLLYQYQIQSSSFAYVMSHILENYIFMLDRFKNN